ncbi:MAG: hypothetical protein AB1571_02570 [Nanoarchaeota archaeon]
MKIKARVFNKQLELLKNNKEYMEAHNALHNSYMKLKQEHPEAVKELDYFFYLFSLKEHISNEAFYKMGYKKGRMYKKKKCTP